MVSSSSYSSNDSRCLLHSKNCLMHPVHSKKNGRSSSTKTRAWGMALAALYYTRGENTCTSNTSAAEGANNTEVQKEKGGQLDFTWSWPSSVEAALTSAKELRTMSNMVCGGDDIGSHLLFSSETENLGW